MQERISSSLRATEAEIELDPPYRVLLHNDEVTPWGFVVVVLHIVFDFDQATSKGVTIEAREAGHPPTVSLGTA